MYSKNWYEYNFTTDEWTLVTSIDPPRGGGFAGVRGASGFSYQGLGFLLFGGTRQGSLNTFHHLTATAYSPATGWKPVKVKIFDTPIFATPTREYEDFVGKMTVFRFDGFTFIIDNQLYHGGGFSGTPAGFYLFPKSEFGDIFMRDMFVYDINASDPATLQLSLKKRLRTPSADYNLEGATNGFAVGNKGNILLANGELARFTP